MLHNYLFLWQEGQNCLNHCATPMSIPSFHEKCANVSSLMSSFFNIRKGFLIIRYWFLNYNSRNTDKCCELSMLTCDVSTSRINSIILYGGFFLEIENCEMQGSHSLIVTSLIKFLTMVWCKCFCQTGSLCLLFGDWLHIKTHGR